MDKQIATAEKNSQSPESIKNNALLGEFLQIDIDRQRQIKSHQLNQLSESTKSGSLPSLEISKTASVKCTDVAHNGSNSITEANKSSDSKGNNFNVAQDKDTLLQAVKKRGAIVEFNARNEPEEIYAVNKAGKLEHWVKVKSEGDKQYWVCDNQNRSKEQVIKASKLADQNERMNPGGMRAGMASHSKDIPVAMTVSRDANNTICLTSSFSIDGSTHVSVTHKIMSDGTRVTSTARKQ